MLPAGTGLRISRADTLVYDTCNTLGLPAMTTINGTNHAAEALATAAEVMTTRGKAHGITEDHVGRVCAVGALLIALGYSTGIPSPPMLAAQDHVAYWRAIEALEDQCEEMLHYRETVTFANDADLLDMPEAMRLAARRLQAEDK